MRLEDIEFHREAMLRPVAVELEPLLDKVGVRLRKTGLQHQFEKPLLQARASEAGRPVERDRPAQPRMSMVADGTRQKVFDRAQIEQPQLFRSLDELLKPIEGDRRRHIEQRPRHSRDRNALDQHAIRLFKATGSVNPHRQSRSPRYRPRDMEWSRTPPRQPMQPSGRVMTENRSRPTSEHRREALPMQRQPRIADDIDAAVDQVQTAAFNCSSHRTRRVTEGLQLPDRYHTVLAIRQAR